MNAFAFYDLAGLKNSSHPLVFTIASGCRTSEILIFIVKKLFSPINANIFCDAGQVPILRSFEGCPDWHMDQLTRFWDISHIPSINSQAYVSSEARHLNF